MYDTFWWAHKGLRLFNKGRVDGGMKRLKKLHLKLFQSNLHLTSSLE